MVQIAWSTTLGGESSPAALVDGIVYTVAGNREVIALDASDGADLWRYPLDGDVAYGPHVANGVLYVGTSFGTVYAITGSENGFAPVAVATPVTQTEAVPPLSAGIPMQHRLPHLRYFQCGKQPGKSRTPALRSRRYRRGCRGQSLGGQLRKQ